MTVCRCAWAAEASPEEIQYHDEEWGVPSRDERHLFEMLILEGAQAGLSWSTVLKKGEGYRQAFDEFDVARIAGYTEEKTAQLLQDKGIVRNRLKVASKPAFRHAWRSGQRCLIPALGYYEWRTQQGGKQPYFVHSRDGAPLVFAGLWEAPADPQTVPCSCTIITRPAAGAMAELHQRIPLLLTPAQAEPWLCGSVDAAADLLQAEPAVEPEFFPVDKAANNVRNQGPQLVQPIRS